MQWTEYLFYIRHFPVEDQRLVERAFEMGKKAHEGQKRQSGEPYFTHPIAVSQMLAQIGADRDTIIAALLHDTVEDTNLTLREIEQEFGGTVATLIDGATKMEEKDVEERPTLDQKIETLRKMFTLMQTDVRIMVIKLADRLHNMQTISFRPPEKQKAVAKETLDIYVKIADRLCMRDMRDDLELRCREILEPETSSVLLDLHGENQELAQEKMHAISARFMESAPSLPLDMDFERKSYEKLRLQYELQQDDQETLTIVNVVFRCSDVDACYRTLGVLHGMWPRESLSFEDFINIPVINGYKGLHTTIIMEDGVRVRCKIRTFEMDAYAHVGVATKCFDSQSHGVQEYLPWTKRLTSLAADTKDRSSEFWDTLQSDILSESILIYGPSGRSVLVPQLATVLDAALYLYADKAMFLTSVRVNGRKVPLSQSLEPGATVEISTGTKPTIHRDWLYLVQTGFGIAMIREELSRQSEGNLQDVGKQILQQALTDRGAGYVEEFDSELIRKSIFTLGYNSLEDAYVAVANRHLEPSEIISALERAARRTKAPGGEQRQDCTFHFTVDRDVSSLRRLLTVYERYNISTQNVRLGLSDSAHLRMKVNVGLAPSEQEAYRQELVAAGAQNIVMRQSVKREMMLMSIVVLLWGLNPVLARYFMESGVSPLTLVSLRSIIFFLFATGFFAVWHYLRSGVYTRIPRAPILALAPAASTFALSLITYLSISILPPSIHLTILRFNVLLLPLVHFFLNRKENRVLTHPLAIFLMVASIVGFFLIPSVPKLGILYALLALGAYVGYSLITERTLQENKIGIRYPYFLFHMGIILGLLGLMFLPWMMTDVNTWLDYLPAIVPYVFFCVFVPHVCFHIVLQRVRFGHVTGISLFEVPLAIVLEILILGLVLDKMTYGLIIVILLSFLLLLQRRLIR